MQAACALDQIIEIPQSQAFYIKRRLSPEQSESMIKDDCTAFTLEMVVRFDFTLIQKATYTEAARTDNPLLGPSH